MYFPRVVYAIKHEPTGKIYVGSTGCSLTRGRNHLSSLRSGTHRNVEMQKDCNDYGYDYSFFILDHISNWSERNKEYLWMDALNTRDPKYGYNTGDKGFVSDISRFEGYRITEENWHDVNQFREWLKERGVEE